MSTPRHSQLLSVPLSERCHTTTPVDATAGRCRGLFSDGWDWHGCDLTPPHTSHHCPCGHQWRKTT
jgi:hypothetical protein